MKQNPDEIKKALSLLVSNIEDGTHATRYRVIINDKPQFILVAVGDAAILFDDLYESLEKTEFKKEILEP